MNIRLTPIVALTVALGLAACQEEEDAEVTETIETEESGVVAEDTLEADNVTVVEPDDEDASAVVPLEEGDDVEAEVTDFGGAAEEVTDEAIGEDQDAEPAATIGEDAVIEGAEGEGAAEVELNEE